MMVQAAMWPCRDAVQCACMAVAVPRASRRPCSCMHAMCMHGSRVEGQKALERCLLIVCSLISAAVVLHTALETLRKTPSRRLRVLSTSAHSWQAISACTRRHRHVQGVDSSACTWHACRAVYTSNATWPQGRRPHTTSATHTAFETLRKMPSTRLRVLPAFHPCRVACCTPRQPRQPATLTQTQTQQTQTQEDASRRSRRRRRRKKTQADARSEDAGR